MLRVFLPRLLVCLLALAAGAGAWAQSGPEQKGEGGRRLSPEQRQEARQRMSPEQRDAMRQRMQERRENGDGPGRRLSPEERRQLRDQVYESNRARPPHAGKKNR